MAVEVAIAQAGHGADEGREGAGSAEYDTGALTRSSRCFRDTAVPTDIPRLQLAYSSLVSSFHSPYTLL